MTCTCKLPIAPRRWGIGVIMMKGRIITINGILIASVENCSHTVHPGFMEETGMFLNDIILT